MSAETVETVRQQGEDDIKGSIKPCLWAQKRMQKKKSITHITIGYRKIYLHHQKS